MVLWIWKSSWVFLRGEREKGGLGCDLVVNRIGIECREMRKEGCVLSMNLM